MGQGGLMSAKEADRYALIVQVVERRMGQSDAAAWLGISVRQVKRLCAAVRAYGTVGVISKRRGVPSNRRIAEREREHFVALVRQHYADFGPSLACEYLRDRHDYTHSAETLRSWMVQDGLWRSKRSKPQRVHSPRQRRSRLGELVQIDGSPHAWFDPEGYHCPGGRSSYSGGHSLAARSRTRLHDGPATQALSHSLLPGRFQQAYAVCGGGVDLIRISAFNCLQRI